MRTAELAGKVNARLVREDHALFNDAVALLALHIPVYALRALMHAEDEAHAVAPCRG